MLIYKNRLIVCLNNFIYLYIFYQTMFKINKNVKFYNYILYIFFAFIDFSIIPSIFTKKVK